MVVVDSSVLIEFLRGSDGAEVQALESLLVRGVQELVAPDLVVFEVLRGCRNPAELKVANELFNTLKVESICSPRWLAAPRRTTACCAPWAGRCAAASTAWWPATASSRSNACCTGTGTSAPTSPIAACAVGHPCGLAMSTLHVILQGPVARVTLARPEVRNAFNADLIAELTAALRRLPPRPDVRAVVLAAEGQPLRRGRPALDAGHGRLLVG